MELSLSKGILGRGSCDISWNSQALWRPGLELTSAGTDHCSSTWTLAGSCTSYRCSPLGTDSLLLFSSYCFSHQRGTDPLHPKPDIPGRWLSGSVWSRWEVPGNTMAASLKTACRVSEAQLLVCDRLLAVRYPRCSDPLACTSPPVLSACSSSCLDSLLLPWSLLCNNLLPQDTQIQRRWLSPQQSPWAPCAYRL